MSEVLGSILATGVAAMALVAAVFALGIVQERAETRTSLAQADRIAAAVAQAASHAATAAADAEAAGAPEPTFRANVDAPFDLQGTGYGIRLETATRTIAVERNGVVLARHAITGAGTTAICQSAVGGGPLVVAYDAPPAPMVPDCVGIVTSNAIHLRSPP